MAENNPFPGENNTGHVWDDNLRELAKPPPRWWMLGFWASILFVIVYTVLYPSWPIGQNATPGLLGWTQIKEYEQGVAQVDAKRGPFEQQISQMTAEEIIADPGLLQYTLASAKVVFGDYCSACHGSGGQGNPSYPVLADDDWLYGGSIAKIKESITNGRKGAMTAHASILSQDEIDALAHWAVELSDGGEGSPEGWELYRAKACNACHGENANGVLAELPGGEIVSVGAANLTDSLWRFEPGGFESARHTIMYGVNQPGIPETRDAVMPAFGSVAKVDDVEVRKLNDQDIKKLAIYVHQLGGGG
jgi:cytochrome c oxidase cbb3-type subunit III